MYIHFYIICNISIQIIFFVQHFFIHIFFPDGPDNCQGTVTCSVTAYSDRSQHSILNITLNPQDGLRCIEGYEFVISGTPQHSSEFPAFASFVIDKALGKAYIDQPIYTIDGEGKRGEIPCLFSITG